MKTTTLLFISILVFTFQINSQTVWNPLNSGSYRTLYAIDFVDANTGYVSSKDSILKTTNAGLTWYKQSPGTYNVHLYDISFYNSNTGYAAGSDGTVLKTTNGGIVWFEQTNGLGNENVNSVFLINASELFVGCDSGKIYSSVNGGTTWNLQSTGTTENILCVYFVTGNKGYASGTNGVILRTVNAGTNWTSQVTGNYWLNAIYFANANAGYTVGGVSETTNSFIILKTSNSGDTWSVVYSGSGCRLDDIYLFNAHIGFAVGSDGNILRTMNGGSSWESQVSGTTGLLYGVCFSSSEIGYVSGSDGIILKTTNGLTFSGSTNNFTPHEFYLSQNYPNPFNPSTNINFDIPISVNVNIMIFNSAGKKIAELVNRNFDAGSHNIVWNAANQSSGVYFYRIEIYSDKLISREYVDTKKMFLLK